MDGFTEISNAAAIDCTLGSSKPVLSTIKFLILCKNLKMYLLAYPAKSCLIDSL